MWLIYTGWSKSLCSLDDYSTKNIQKYFKEFDDLKMAITEYIRNVDRAILNTVFENTVRRVNKYLETGGGHFEQYL
jgi:6-pyruvoyl-tetrahydropterin synthase